MKKIDNTLFVRQVDIVFHQGQRVEIIKAGQAMGLGAMSDWPGKSGTVVGGEGSFVWVELDVGGIVEAFPPFVRHVMKK